MAAPQGDFWHDGTRAGLHCRLARPLRPRAARHYRTTMWKIGHDQGFNSNPNMILYAYANHEPLPKVPFVWNQTLTNFNVAISVLSLFVLITKMIALIMHVYFPIIGTFVSVAMCVLYAVSVYGQAGPDHADPRYPSNVAWYISKSCSYAEPYGAAGDCLMAKGCFAVTVLLMVVYVVYVGFGVLALVPNKKLDEEADDSDDDSRGSPSGKQSEQRIPLSPRTPRAMPGSMASYMPGGSSATEYSGYYASSPFTPRTQAFHTLDRTLPLRA